MIRLELYDNTKTYMYPNSEIATPERVRADHPATAVFEHVVETDASGQVFYALENLSAMRGRLDIDPSLSSEEAVLEIERIVNLPQPEPEPTAEERIAAAMEFQNLMTI